MVNFLAQTKMTTNFEYVPFTMTEDNKCMSTKEDVKLSGRSGLTGRVRT